MTDMRAEFEARFPNLWGFAWNGHTYDATSEQVDNGFAVFCLEYRARWEAWQAARQTAGVPEGFVAVPVEPTTVQVNAGVDADDMRTGFETVKHIYRAMLAAAPQPAQQAQRVGDALLQFGYAPGQYSFICHTCGEERLAAKRSLNCKECAERAAIAKGGEEGK